MAPAVVTGRVAGKGLSDELKGTFYAVVETPAGRAYYVPLDARSAQTVGVGDLVSLATPPEAAVRPADRQIAEVARARGVVFAVDPSAGGDAQGLARRLRDLERAGLVAAEGPARWKVPPDLLDRLAERARDAPARYRLVVRKEPLSLKEQVVHRGPVWLDRLETETLAYWGLGADMRQAVAERGEALRRLGIEPDDPDRVAKLRDLESRALGAEIAARSGLTFLAWVPGGPVRRLTRATRPERATRRRGCARTRCSRPERSARTATCATEWRRATRRASASQGRRRRRAARKTPATRPERATRRRGCARIPWRRTARRAATETPARRTTVAKTERARAVPPSRAPPATNAMSRGRATRRAARVPILLPPMARRVRAHPYATGHSRAPAAPVRRRTRHPARRARRRIRR